VTSGGIDRLARTRPRTKKLPMVELFDPLSRIKAEISSLVDFFGRERVGAPLRPRCSGLGVRRPAEVGGPDPDQGALRAADPAPPTTPLEHPVVQLASELPGG